MLKLRWRQGHAHILRTHTVGRQFGHGTPTTANFKQALAPLQAHLLECALHFGLLGFLQGHARMLKQGRRVIHARVEPAAVKSVAQIVVGMDVFQAVGLVIAVLPMPQTVQQTAPPRAIHQALQVFTVAQANPQQQGHIGTGPALLHKGFGQTNVTPAQHIGADLPILHMDPSVQHRVAAAIGVLFAVGPAHGELAVAELLQPALHHPGRVGHLIHRRRCGTGKRQTFEGSGQWHVKVPLKWARAQRAFCQKTARPCAINAAPANEYAA